MRTKLIALLIAAPAFLGAQAASATNDSTFRQISLTDALRLAHDNNVSNITADNAIRTANNNVRSAKAAMYPTLSASAGQSKSAGDRLGANGELTPYNGKWTYNTGLSSNVTLFDAGKM